MLASFLSFCPSIDPTTKYERGYQHITCRCRYLLSPTTYPVGGLYFWSSSYYRLSVSLLIVV